MLFRSTSYGIEYSTTNGFLNGSGTRIPAGSNNAGVYAVTAVLLSPNTTYYYKAFGVNISGTGYGNQLSFTTLPIPDGLTVYNSPITQNAIFHYSINGITPGNYGLRIISSTGQLVFKKEMTVTVNYIDESFMLPVNMPAGMYTLQLINRDISFKASRKFIKR